jgi:DNA-binding CsgD family transcriptional regulator
MPPDNHPASSDVVSVPPANPDSPPNAGGDLAVILRAFRDAVTPGDAAVLLRSACEWAIRERRVDLLFPESHHIKALPDGVERDCALAIIALASADTRRAYRHLQSTPAQNGSLQDAELQALVYSEIALAATALGQWVTVLECVHAGRTLLSHTPLTTVTRQSSYDLAGLAAVAECHTLSGNAELVALKELIATPRARHALTDEHALAMVSLGSVQSTRGNLGEAALDLSRGLALTPTTRQGLYAHAAIELCMVRVRQGRWDDADEAVRALTSAFTAVDNSWLDPQILAIRGLLFAIRGDTDSAIPVIEHAALLARDFPTVTVSTVLLHARICIAISQNDWNRLRHILDDAEDLPYRRPYRSGEWNALRLLTAWHLRNTVEFRRRLAEWGLLSDAESSPYYWAFLTIHAESEERYDDGVTTIRTALDRISLDDDPLGRAWVRIVAGTYLTRHGKNGDKDPVQGLTAYEDAQKELTQLGATGYAKLCENIIQQTSAELSRARNVDPVTVLTEQQLRVAHLVSDGYTSTEISDILHLSRKTIDFHVANIIRRLNLSNRREITRIINP